MRKLALLALGMTVALSGAFAQPVHEEVVPQGGYPAYHVYGFGAAKTRGGLDGRIIKVTNLNADGPGSFKEAIEAATEGQQPISDDRRSNGAESRHHVHQGRTYVQHP